MDKFKELRCPNCNRLLMKYKLDDGQLTVEIKCNNCKTVSGITAKLNPEEETEE